MESLAFVHDDHALEKKRYFGNAIQTILPMQTIFDPHTPSLLGIKFREMIVKGGATNLGTIFFKHQYENVQVNIPKLLCQSVQHFQKLGKEHKVNQGFSMDLKSYLF